MRRPNKMLGKLLLSSKFGGRGVCSRKSTYFLLRESKGMYLANTKNNSSYSKTLSIVQCSTFVLFNTVDFFSWSSCERVNRNFLYFTQRYCLTRMFCIWPEWNLPGTCKMKFGRLKILEIERNLECQSTR